MRSAYVSFAIAALVAGACAHDGSTRAAARGEPVGVNATDAKSAPVTNSITGGINPSPAAMATTSSSPTPVDTASSMSAGMGSATSR
jgi:hypothetical protein